MKVIIGEFITLVWHFMPSASPIRVRCSNKVNASNHRYIAAMVVRNVQTVLT